VTTIARQSRPTVRGRTVNPEAAVSPAPEPCLLDLLQEQVRTGPDRLAVRSAQGDVTFRDLLRSSLRVADRVREEGVSSDDCVGLFVEPSAELIYGVWGILAAGGAYLPLASDYPDERLRYMIGDSRTQVIVCQESLMGRLAALVPGDTRIVALSDASRQGRAVSHIHHASRPRDLAYVIYTSGSTGNPKGVMIEQRSIVNQMRWLNRAQGVGGGVVVLQKTPMSFDAAQWEILAPCVGATVVAGSPGLHRDPERLLDAIARHGVTALQCVPTLLQAILESESLERASSLRQVLSGGEALSKSMARRCLEALPQAQLVNLYGPTECTINSSAFTVDPASLADGADTISIGVPVDGTAYQILGSDRQPVAAGEVGELYISGVQLARGYLGRPDLTETCFPGNSLTADPAHDRLYRTGDLTYANPDGSLQFVGRTDNQVKLRGFRIELDEVRVAIEKHDWIRHAGVVVKRSARSGAQSLLAFVELNPAEAALMDQGKHGAHHQSKSSKLQLKAQLSNLGCRSEREVAGRRVVELPGTHATAEQRRLAFSRKTYRFYEGGPTTKADLLGLLRNARSDAQPHRAAVPALTVEQLGEILRNFGQHRSPERLLPKYAYASPGALYATQLYLELVGVAGLAPAYYYYHPVHHQLVAIARVADATETRVVAHLLGKTRAIKPVYETNVEEVLRFEAGHMVGLFDEVLAPYGLAITSPAGGQTPTAELECDAHDHYLGRFEIAPVSRAAAVRDLAAMSGIDIYVQAQPGRVDGLAGGQYVYENGDLALVSEQRIERRDVIAINQRVFDRASFGLSLISRLEHDWLSYVALGRLLQRLMMNDVGLGFMSSGYSSRTGRPLPAARRLDSILEAAGRPSGSSYFCVGGRVSQEQLLSEGMQEDAVHMQGPAELVKDDLARRLPDYMVPNRVIVLDKLPLTASGKVDTGELAALPEADVEKDERPVVAPRTAAEARVAEIWQSVTKHDSVSMHDNFFDFGGNSLMAVTMVNRLTHAFGRELPLQILFEAPTVAQLAAMLEDGRGNDCSRLIRLHGPEAARPIYCWPGLGGYPMNLKLLAAHAELGRPVYGIQAFGINAGETPYSTTAEMAGADVKAIRCQQSEGPYTLMGYSFGARVAFETAYQLEQSGERVDQLLLIAPGSPKVRAKQKLAYLSDPDYRRQVYRTILFSVFAGSITHPALEEGLQAATEEERFAAFISDRVTHLAPEMVTRISRIVRETYEFKYSFTELAERRINAPVTIFKARGDDYSFLETAHGYSAVTPTVIDLAADHYAVLKPEGVTELALNIRDRLLTGSGPELMAAGEAAS
jgi:amino acid adenylation domain-containing protein